MVRSTMLAMALLMAVGASVARGQDADEVNRLKDKIELLETKLKLAEKENELLKKEVELLKAGGAKKPTDDGFGVGTKLTGTYNYSHSVNGKVESVGLDWEFEVTKRSGKDFTAEIYASRRKAGIEVEGTIENQQVKFKATKALTDGIPPNVVGNLTFSGRFEKGMLTGPTSKLKAEPGYKGKVELKAIKD